MDTSTRYCSAAALAGVEVLALTEWDAGGGHTGQLESRIRELLSAVSEPPQAVAVAAGPGGFTSLRVSMAFAKGLCLAWPAKLVTVSTMQALALSAPEGPMEVAALAPAGRDGYFFQLFGRRNGVLDARTDCQLRTTAELAVQIRVLTLLVGSIAAEDLESMRGLAGGVVETDHLQSYRRLARYVGVAACSKLARNGADEVLSAVPTYHRTVATTSPARGWGKA